MVDNSNTRKAKTADAAAIRAEIRRLNDLARSNILTDPHKAFDIALQAYDLANEAGDREGVFHSLHTQIKYYRFTHNIPECRRVIDDAEQVAESLQQWKLTEHVLYARAALLYTEGRIAEAREAFHITIAHAQRNGSTSTGSLIGLGLIYCDAGQYDLALQEFYKTMEIAQSNNQPEMLASCYTNIASVYLTSGHYDTSMRFMQRSYELNRQIGNRKDEATVLMNLGIVASENLQQYDKALEFFGQAEELARTIEMNHVLARTLHYTGMVYLRLQQRETALDYALRALELARRINAPDLVTETLRTIGELHEHAGHYPRAIEVFDEALALAEKVGNPYFLMTIHRNLARLHEINGTILACVEHHRKYIEMYEQHLGKKAQHTIARLHLEYELRKADEEKQELQHKTGHLVLESERLRSELLEATLHLARKNEALSKQQTEIENLLANARGRQRNRVQALLDQIQQSLRPDNSWSHFEQQFQKVYNSFTASLSARFPALSPTEIKICCLLRLNLSSKDTASILCISLHTLNTHRYHIRKKLGLDKNGNLVSLLLSL